MAQISSPINITHSESNPATKFILFHGPVPWTLMQTVIRYNSILVKVLLLASVNVVHMTSSSSSSFFGRHYLSTGIVYLKFDITSNFLLLVTIFILVGL